MGFSDGNVMLTRVTGEEKVLETKFRVSMLIEGWFVEKVISEREKE